MPAVEYVAGEYVDRFTLFLSGNSSVSFGLSTDNFKHFSRPLYGPPKCYSSIPCSTVCVSQYSPRVFLHLQCLKMFCLTAKLQQHLVFLGNAAIRLCEDQLHLPS